MIGKISTPRGTRLAPLVYYLFGPGRCEEHTDPHLVAGWRHPAELEPSLRPDGSRDFRELLGLLAQPHAAMGDFAMARPVWHCSMRAAPEDKLLSDDEWAQIAGDVMHRTGLSRRGAEDEGVRWIAVRHGPDHIHLVAMLARQDFRRPRLDFERYRVREACRAAEARYGLRATAPGDRTAARCASRAESEKATRRGLGEPPRVTLRRAVTTAAACAGSEREFFTRLELAGVLARKRFSRHNPGQVTGYAVALPGDTSKAGGPVWYSGGKLAPDLTWPKLRQRWGQPATAGPRFTPAERAAIWDHAQR
ncbi:MAG: relaxase/mobilization nuclease domain-containing protein, partial [Streptosporangiaceae bacterium]